MARLSGRPLLDTRADATLFVGRAAELARLRRSVTEGLNVLVAGERGAGKTSLVRRLPAALRDGAGQVPHPVFVDAADVDGPAELLLRVATALGVRAEEAASARDVVAALAAGPLAPGDVGPLAPGDVGTQRASRTVVVDGLPVAVAHPVFGQLRDELWALPLTWVVTCADRDEPAFLRPPADAFFDVVLRLDPLPDDAVRDLLRRRSTVEELDDEALAEVAALAGGNPRRALDLARRLLTDPQAAEALRHDVLRRREAVERLGAAAAMLLAELETSGPASASDPGLLARLGWTRARATQVLGRLEEAGLVEATTVPNGPGRPRKVYRTTGDAGAPGRAGPTV